MLLQRAFQKHKMFFYDKNHEKFNVTCKMHMLQSVPYYSVFSALIISMRIIIRLSVALLLLTVTVSGDFIIQRIIPSWQTHCIFQHLNLKLELLRMYVSAILEYNLVTRYEQLHLPEGKYGIQPVFYLTFYRKGC